MNRKAKIMAINAQPANRHNRRLLAFRRDFFTSSANWKFIKALLNIFDISSDLLEKWFSFLTFNWLKRENFFKISNKNDNFSKFINKIILFYHVINKNARFLCFSGKSFSRSVPSASLTALRRYKFRDFNSIFKAVRVEIGQQKMKRKNSFLARGIRIRGQNLKIRNFQILTGGSLKRVYFYSRYIFIKSWPRTSRSTDSARWALQYL